MDVVLASSNQHKIAELTALLNDLNINIRSQSEFAIADADETGLSFVENAIIKARHAAQHSGLPAIADDSGIEVDALNGAPGIYSARFAGVHGDDAANRQKLLAELEPVPESERGATFQCVLVYMRHADDATPLICSGSWHGRIAFAEKGEHGFGYDPIFYLPEFNCTAAELDPAEKNRISHRGKALVQMKRFLLS